MKNAAKWTKVLLIAVIGSVPLFLFFKWALKGLSVGLYLGLFGLSFIIMLFIIMIAVAVYVSITEKMEVEEEDREYSADSAEESGRRQSGTDED